MQDAMRIGAAALGGYVLGRTKKAKTAIGLALWLSGRGRARDMVRDQAKRAFQSEHGQELMAELRGPVLGAGKQAAVSLYEAQASRLSDNLSRRTGQLTEAGGETGRRAARKGTDTAERLRHRRRPGAQDEEPDEQDDREPEDEYPADEDDGGEDAEEYEDEYDDEEAPEDEYEDEAEYVEDEEELPPRRARQRASA